MNIVLFKDLTTEGHISELEKEAAKYDGLYVDMGNLPERKYVKDKAKDIGALIKAIERARVDRTAQFRGDINAEAMKIVTRLKEANKPFSLLIDEYTQERAIILKAEKDRIDAIESAVKLECDHEFALLMNDKYDSQYAERMRGEELYRKHIEIERVEREKGIAERAAESARLAEIARQNTENNKLRSEENARLADHEHRRKVNRRILTGLMTGGLSEDAAKKTIKIILSGVIPVRINY